MELACSNVHEFRLEYGKHTTYEALSSGLQLLWKDDMLHVILDAYPYDPGFPDLATNDAFVSCDRCELQVIDDSL